MTKIRNDADLNVECIAFSRYLVHQEPNNYVMAKYRDAHTASDNLQNHRPNLFDELLLRVSTLHALTTKMVDSYASLFSRSALVRKKMVLVIALLESCAPSYSYFDSIDPGGYLVFFLRMFRQGIFFILSLVLAIVLIMPVHLLFFTVSGFAHLERTFASLLRRSFNSLGSFKKPSQDWVSSTEIPPDVPTN